MVELDQLFPQGKSVTVTNKGETIKLTKNSRGYSWEIKLDVACPQTLKEINEDMIKLFGGGYEKKKEGKRN